MLHLTCVVLICLILITYYLARWIFFDRAYAQVISERIADQQHALAIARAAERDAQQARDLAREQESLAIQVRDQLMHITTRTSANLPDDADLSDSELSAQAPAQSSCMNVPADDITRALVTALSHDKL
jgi:hypothetical protein